MIRTVSRFTVISVACIDVSLATECIIGDAVCRSKLGFSSSCAADMEYCEGDGGAAVHCKCGDFLTPGVNYPDQDDILVPDFPFIGDNYPNMTIIAVPDPGVLSTPAPATTYVPSVTVLPPAVTDSPTVTDFPVVDPTDSPAAPPTDPPATESPETDAPATQAPVTEAPATEAPATQAPVTEAPVTEAPATEAPATTRAPTPAPSYDGSSMFVWAEWPSMWGEPDWIEYYAKLVSFSSSSPLNVNKLVLRILDPVYGTVATSPETAHDLWTVSTSSVIYTQLLTQLPASVTTFDVYPYVMDQYNRDRWMGAMGTTATLEAVFMYCAQWNTLLAQERLSIRCGGVTVDGEERRGYLNELGSVQSYKDRYALSFGYSTGYPQVGVLGSMGDYVDEFYLQFYDFYVRESATVQLVMNTDVGHDDAQAYIQRLNDVVWAQYLPYYESPKVRFMWSMQHSTSNACIYPDGPSSCGIKEDFGAWSLNGFLSFVQGVRDMFPTKFGNKPHGVFQFSFVPNSWMP